MQKFYRYSSFLHLLFLTLLMLSVVSCVSNAPLPSTLKIENPPSDVPPDIAAFSGIWEGRWRFSSVEKCRECSSSINTVLVVEKISSSTARLIISHPPFIGYKGGFFHATARVLPGPTLEGIEHEGLVFKYKLNKELNRVTGYLTITKLNETVNAYMTRRKSK